MPSQVSRGGSWNSYARYVRAACRSWDSAAHRVFDLGFRCRVRGAEPSQVAAKYARKQERDSSPASGERTTATGSAMAQPTWIQLIDRQEESTPVPQGPVAKIISDVEELTLRRISRPDWASAIGRDEFGLWADLKVEGQAWRDEGSSSSSQPSALSPQLSALSSYPSALTTASLDSTRSIHDGIAGGRVGTLGWRIQASPRCHSGRFLAVRNASHAGAVGTDDG